MYDSAVEFPFAVHDVLAGDVPQAELAHLHAVTAFTVSRLMGSDGQGEFWCAQLSSPACRRINEADSARYDHGMLGRDEHGLYAWAHYIALRPHHPGVFRADCAGIAADLAYVVDVSLGADDVFESSKVDWVATVIVSATPAVNRGLSAAAAPPYRAVAVAPSRRLHDGTGSPASHLRQGLDEVIVSLADLTGTVVAQIPRPVEVKARKHSRHRGVGPSYSWDGHEVRYHTLDPVEGQLVWSSTTDLDEALSWMADDVARSVALSWAQRTPAAHTMGAGELRWMLATPMWLTLMTALDSAWAERTRNQIALLRRRQGPRQHTSDSNYFAGRAGR